MQAVEGVDCLGDRDAGVGGFLELGKDNLEDFSGVEADELPENTKDF
jgi:hypothetical protein